MISFLVYVSLITFLIFLCPVGWSFLVLHFVDRHMNKQVVVLNPTQTRLFELARDIVDLKYAIKRQDPGVSETKLKELLDQYTELVAKARRMRIPCSDDPMTQIARYSDQYQRVTAVKAQQKRTRRSRPYTSTGGQR